MACAQGCEGALCKLAVILDLTRVDLDATTAKAISQAALQLGAQGVVARVSIVKDPAIRLSIKSEILQALAPVLHKLELHPVAALSANIVGNQKPPSRGNCVNLEYTVLQQANQSLRSLCVLHQFEGYSRFEPVLPGIGCCIAQLGGLRKLHLTLEDSYRTDNCFAQLAKLSQLRYLALQCQQCDVSCANVILSNQATLRSITMASCSWSLDTYAALDKASVLTVLSVRVNMVTESDARILANLKTPQSLRLEVQECGRMGWRAMEALSSGPAKITFLSLWGMLPDQDVSYWKHLMSMRYLTTLVIDKPMGFSGDSVSKQPRLSSLYLVDCNDITEQGVAHIVGVFPALSSVLLCKEDKRIDSQFSRCRRVAQQSMFWRYHAGPSMDRTSTNGLFVQLATVMSRSTGLQVMCNHNNVHYVQTRPAETDSKDA